MSKYFVKWLPVEEEIKKGDYWQHPNGAIFPYTEAYAKGPIASLKPSKVKLFLCSKDIEVGDEVNSIEYGKGKVVELTENGLFNVEINDIVYQEFLDFFKVIGEISPEAKWVKEGDEFNEDNISGYAAFQGNLNDFTTYLLDTPEESIKNSYIKIFKIKCLCCGSFV